MIRAERNHALPTGWRKVFAKNLSCSLLFRTMPDLLAMARTLYQTTLESVGVCRSLSGMGRG